MTAYRDTTRLQGHETDNTEHTDTKDTATQRVAPTTTQFRLHLESRAPVCGAETAISRTFAAVWRYMSPTAYRVRAAARRETSRP